MKWLRPLLAAAAVCCLAPALGGCVVFKASPSAAVKPLGPVQIKTVICASNYNAGSTCTESGNSGQGGADGVPYQLLIGYRLPAGTAAPTAVEAVKVVGFSVQRLKFRRSDSYTNELQGLAPQAGFQWVGYLSDQFVYDEDNPNRQDATVYADFGLPHPVNGEPFVGPFRYQVVVGAREAQSDLSRPVECGGSKADLFSPSDPHPSADSTICVDDPTAAQFESSRTATTSDLGIRPEREVTARGGTTATVPFIARYAGQAPTTLSVAATTDIRGAKTTASQGSLTPGPNSVNPIAVKVSVPAATKPGRYHVSLFAGRDQNAIRTNTATIVVPKLLGRIRSRVKTQWRVTGRLTRVLKLTVTGVPRGARVSLKCRGRGCPKSKRLKGRTVKLAKRFRKRLRAGALIEVRVTKSRYIGKVVRYRIRRGALPRSASLCLPMGAKKARRKCR